MAEAEKSSYFSVFSDPTPTSNSLFGEILDWMLAPLLLIWPITIAISHHVAAEIASHPYDAALAEHVVQIEQEMRTGPHGVRVSLPKGARVGGGDDNTDIQFFQVALDGGDVIAGEEGIPGLRPGDRGKIGTTMFRNAEMMGETVRIAYRLVPSPADARPLLIQVAETRRQHNNLSSRIISGVLLPQFAIIPLAVVLVWLGLTRGLAPLVRLQERIRARRPDDLSPIDMRTVPEELRPMIAALNNNMARLQDNLDAQQRFIAAAAHQLKTPLTGLKTQTELALREGDRIQMRDYLLRIATSVDHAAHLTHQLLQLARLDASHESPHEMAPVDMGALARDVIADAIPRALAKDIDLGFEAEGVRLVVLGVPLLLREMLVNLTDNAIKYTPQGGRVTLRFCDSPTPAIEVEDTGIGIPVEDRQHVFERFYRALGTEAEGSGLGLAIVREVADQHRISIAVLDNPQGKGTLIRLVLTRAVVKDQG